MALAKKITATNAEENASLAIAASREYRLVIRLDSPVSDCSIFSPTILAQGWVMLPHNSSSAESLPELSFLLEEHSGSGTILQAGMEAVGVQLDSDNSKNAYIFSNRLFRGEDQVRDPSKTSDGETYRFEAEINVEALIPQSGEPPKLYSLLVGTSAGEQEGVSNRVTFSLPAKKSWTEAYGGFLSPSTKELVADFLVVRGWAVRQDDKLKRVEIFLNDISFGEAELGLQSSAQGDALPDVIGSAACRFSKSIWIKDAFCMGLSPEICSRSIRVKTCAEFSSGESLELSGLEVAWSRELQTSAEQFSIGEVSSVSRLANGEVRLEGWTIPSGGITPRTYLEWSRAELTLESSSEVAAGFSRVNSGGLSHRFPTRPVGAPRGFRFDVSPEVFGSCSSGIRLCVREPNSTIISEIGPRGMWETFSELLGAGQATAPLLKQVVAKVKTLQSGIVENISSSVHRVRGDHYTFLPREVSGCGAVSDRSKSSEPKRVLLALHNLSAVEGAPKVLAQVIEYLIDNCVSPEALLVLSARDGELRSQFEKLGIRIEIIPELQIFELTWERYHRGLASLADYIADFDPSVVLANVTDSFWAIDGALSAQVPSAMVIHESINPLECTHDLDERLVQRFLRALIEADCLCFVSESTKALFSPLLKEENTAVVPNGVDLEAIEKESAQWTKGGCRKELGIDAECVVSVIGTTTHRKGQDIFLREMACLQRSFPEKSFAFLVVGAREMEFLDELKSLTEALSLQDSVRFIPEQPEVGKYFFASDVVVISSRQESAPLVSLEAFAYGIPLVSTGVFGLSEQIEHRKSGLLFDHTTEGDLADKVAEVLKDSELAETLVRGGKAALRDTFSLSKTLPQYWDVLKTISKRVVKGD